VVSWFSPFENRNNDVYKTALPLLGRYAAKVVGVCEHVLAQPTHNLLSQANINLKIEERSIVPSIPDPALLRFARFIQLIQFTLPLQSFLVDFAQTANRTFSGTFSNVMFRAFVNLASVAFFISLIPFALAENCGRRATQTEGQQQR
jgi:hypothetical protein